MPQPHGSVIELCHVVRDIDAAIRRWMQDMGAGPFFLGEMKIAEHRYRGAPSLLAIKVAFGFSGGLLIELVQPLADDRSVFREALDATGEGYHHVMLNLDFDEGFKRFSERGYEPALQSTGPMGERCALFDTRKDNGGFVEIMDLTKSFAVILPRLEQAHSARDGHTLEIRPLSDLFS